MKNDNGKYIFLFTLYASIFAAALHYMVLPSSKICEKEYALGAGRTSLSFEIMPEYSYMCKISVPANSAAEVICNFNAAINGDTVQLHSVDRVEGGLKLCAFVDRSALRRTYNSLVISPWQKTVKVAFSNCKKIYLRAGYLYVGDFYMFFNKYDEPTGYPVRVSLLYGAVIAFVWVCITALLSKIFWCDAQRVCRLHYSICAGLLILLSAQRYALHWFGYPFMAGGKCSFVLMTIICVLTQVVTICSCGFERFVLIVRKTQNSIAVWEERYGLSKALVWLMIVIYAGVFFSLQVIRHRGFFPSMDLNGIIQLVYNAMQGRIWETQVSGCELGTYLRYHLQPIDLFFVPLYYIIRSNLVFYFVQTAVIAAGAVPVYYIASEILRSRGFGLLFALLYLLYPSVHNCTMYGFHFEELTIGIIPFAFYALMKQRRALFLVLCVLMMMIKENIAALVCMFGVYAFFRGERLVGACVAIVSAVWFFLCIFVIIPYYTPAGEMTYSHSFFSNLGVTGDAVVKNILVNAAGLISSVFADPFKSTFLFHLFAPLAFLPFLAPDVLMIALPVFAQLLLSPYVRFHSITIFYQSAIVPCLIIASIVGFRRLLAIKDWILRISLMKRYAVPNAIFGGIVLVSMITFAIKNITPQHAPGYFIKGVYSISSRDIFIKRYLDRVPAEVSAAVPLMFYEYLSGRRLAFNNTPEQIKRFMPDIVFVNAYICWPAYGEYRYNNETLRFLRESPDYVPVLKVYGFNIYEKRQAPCTTGMCVYDWLQFQKNEVDGKGPISYAGAIEIPADGVYSLKVNLDSEVVQQTTEANGYDSFECLPGFRNVDRIAQSFTPPDSLISSVWVYVRRVGTPRLSLLLCEDAEGKPSERIMCKVSGVKGYGILFKYGWLRFDVGSARLDPAKKYWLVLSADGDGYTSRYEIAAFSKGMKGGKYGERVLYAYADAPDEWREPYVRSPGVEDEQGNYVDGIVFRTVKKGVIPDVIYVKIDGKIVPPGTGSVGRSSGGACKVVDLGKVPLTKGRHQLSISSPYDFQLDYVELLMER